MTWSNTKLLKNSQLFTESNYKKRKAHSNFMDEIKCEKIVVTSLKKRVNLTDKLKSLVLCCGVTYGEEERGNLHYLFKLAWLNEKYLPVIGNGDNHIPLLHVRDLAR